MEADGQLFGNGGSAHNGCADAGYRRHQGRGSQAGADGHLSDAYDLTPFIVFASAADGIGRAQNNVGSALNQAGGGGDAG